MELTTRLIRETENGPVIEAQVILKQNDLQIVIATSTAAISAYGIEPTERVLAKAMKKASAWLAGGPVNLARVGGAVMRTREAVTNEQMAEWDRWNIYAGL